MQAQATETTLLADASHRGAYRNYDKPGPRHACASSTG